MDAVRARIAFRMPRASCRKKRIACFATPGARRRREPGVLQRIAGLRRRGFDGTSQLGRVQLEVFEGYVERVREELAARERAAHAARLCARAMLRLQRRSRRCRILQVSVKILNGES